MIKLLVIFIFFATSIAQAADLKFENKTFVGTDRIHNTVCEIHVDKIKKGLAILLQPDTVTITVTIGNSAPYTFTMGEWDLLSGFYSRMMEDDDLRFKFGDDGAPAQFERFHFTHDGLVDSPSFSSSRLVTECRYLQIAE